MHALIADWALLDDGFAADVRIEVADGVIVSVMPGGAGAGERVAGALLPGMTDLHSHAFQRSFAGQAQDARGDDDFWTWREAMYARAACMTPDVLRPVAAYLAMRLLQGGYTGLVEFHYLHGSPALRGEMAEAVMAGAADAGMPLTLLFSAYEVSGFGAAGLAPGQVPFACCVGEAVELLRNFLPRGSLGISFGLAPHSLRAVSAESLRELVGMLSGLPPVPVHIHVAEQTREVAACVADRGAPPVAWLLDHAPVDWRWCLIHATHASADELRRVAATRAVVGLCPTTEADLGDGVFDLLALTEAGGGFGVGSDSNVGTDAFAELRQLEWSQRLRLQARCIGTARRGHAGVALWQAAAAGGAQAAGRAAGRIAAGCAADFVTIQPAPEVARMGPASWLDAAVLAPAGRPAARDVMVAGAWVVRDGAHAREKAITLAYRRALGALG